VRGGEVAVGADPCHFSLASLGEGRDVEVDVWADGDDPSDVEEEAELEGRRRSHR